MKNSRLDGNDREFLQSDPRCGKTRLAGVYLRRAASALAKVRELRPDIDITVHNGVITASGGRLPLVFRILSETSKHDQMDGNSSTNGNKDGG